MPGVPMQGSRLILLSPDDPVIVLGNPALREEQKAAATTKYGQSLHTISI
eukprot:m.237223 g.237223  ORF g.237223 m.237223 type:complete len:50 (+) comp15791_c0_seq2:2692-2841(+)